MSVFKNIFKSRKKKKLPHLLHREELNDQFLRLTEIFGCEIDIYHVMYRKNSASFFRKQKIIMYVSAYHTDKKKEIIKELDLIKTRMGIEYPIKIALSEIPPPGWDMEHSAYYRVNIEYL